MAWMIRKQIYIEPAQEANLKEQARSLGLTEAEVIRRAINRQMTFPVSGICTPGKRKRRLFCREWPENHAPGAENSTGKVFTKKD